MDRHHTLVVGVFASAAQARDAIEALREAGYEPSSVSLFTRHGDVALDSDVDVSDVAASGAVAGGVLGGLAGWLVGLSAVVLPGIGPLVTAGGVAATAVAGATVGAGVGAIAAALAADGVPEDEARTYEAAVVDGRTLLTVHAGDDAEMVQMLFRRSGALEANASDVSVVDRTPVERTGADQPTKAPTATDQRSQTRFQRTNVPPRRR